MQRQVARSQLMAVLLLLVALSYMFVFFDPALWSSLKYTLIALVTCLLIVLFETRYKNAQSKVLSWFSGIGFYSYFTYLFHMFNIELILKLPGVYHPTSELSFWGVVVAALIVTQIQAVLSFRFFEGPLMRYGRGLEQQSQSRSVTVNASKDVT
jgi:peptidoglycan/LPS O-acetylase OafA/YrhL